MQQEERVSVLRELKDELLEYRNEFEGYSTYENFDASFRMQDPECKNVKLLSAYDLYISTVLPLEHKEIRYIPRCTRLWVLLHSSQEHGMCCLKLWKLLCPSQLFDIRTL